jgi:DNA-binding response OmpR family regulator
MSEQLPKILVIDDDDAIRSMLYDWLSDEYQVFVASDGLKGIAFLEENEVDLVVSDINMPGINGFETLHRIRDKNPNQKCALITDYDVDSYIRFALEENITNIIVKTSPFNIEELFKTIDNLISGKKVFGIKNYMLPGTDMVQATIKETRDLDPVREGLISYVSHREQFVEERGSSLRMIFEEIASNAIYHAHGYDKLKEVKLKPHEFVEVFYGEDKEKFGFSVLDQSGNLTKEIVLTKILRAMSKDGVFDFSGRGLFLTRNFSDRVVINIEPGKRTEIIALYYFNDDFKVNKPLYINEI